MNDDWRVHVRLGDENAARTLATGLERYDLAHDLGGGYHDRVVVSHDGPEVFLYTATRQQAEAAERAVRALADREGWSVDLQLHRWHPVSEEWTDPDAPLPDTAEALAGERAALMEEERRESREQGYPDFEVRVHCRSAGEAEQLADQLAAEGIRSIRRWEFVVIGVADEDGARALAERLRAQAPADVEVVAEGSVARTVHSAPLGTPFNPFSVFGGLGG